MSEPPNGNAGTIQKIVFSSDALPPELDERARFAFWRDLHEERFGSTDLYFLTDREFSVHAEFAQLGTVGLGRLAGTMRRISRTRRHVAADPSDMFILALNRGKSEIACVQRGREVVVNPGAATLVTNSDASEVLAKADGSVFTVNVPRARLRGLVADTDDLVAKSLQPGSAVRYLGRYLDLVLGPDGIGTDPALAAHVETTLLDLVALVLGATRDVAELANGRGVRAGRLRTIKADIFEYLGNRDLTIGWLAGRHRVSPRYIQMLFEREGTTFSEFILTARLARVHQSLCDRRLADQQVGSLAYEAGFSDLPYFNRAFRRRYGATPSDVRAAAARAR